MLRAICGTQWFYKTAASISIRHSASCKYQSGTDEVIWHLFRNRVNEADERSEWPVTYPQSPDRGLLPVSSLSRHDHGFPIILAFFRISDAFESIRSRRARSATDGVSFFHAATRSTRTSSGSKRENHTPPDREFGQQART